MKAKHWIRIEDALPEKSGFYLVCGAGSIACRAWEYEQQEWKDYEMTKCPGLVMENITHWQPLCLPNIAF